MRAHYHDFKEQAFTNYKSAYANQFTGKEGEPTSSVANTRSNDAIQLGNNQLPMITTNASYGGKKQEVGGVGWKEPKESGPGVVLGDNSSDMQTMNQQFYNAKLI